MCEANAYLVEDGQEKLFLEAVDLAEPQAGGAWRLVSIFGEQKIIRGRIKRLALVEHKMFFEPLEPAEGGTGGPENSPVPGT